MLAIRTLSWLTALATVLLWIPPVARMKAPSLLEVAFFQGGLLIPILGAVLALVALRTPPRAAQLVALVVNALLAAAHALLVQAPIS